MIIALRVGRVFLSGVLGIVFFLAGATTPARASELLEPVIASLPDIPLVVQGELHKRGESGTVEKKYAVEMVLDWKADVPTARYTIRDAFGGPLQHLAITWASPEEPEYRYLEGSPLRAAPLPPLNNMIMDTDISWIDLSLSFLWWKGGVERGEEAVRGRDCRIIDLPAPEKFVEAFDGVRLWVDKKVGIVLRAEGYDAAGTMIRRMDVKSFKKINGRWVIKDIDFERFPAGTRTTLLVRDVVERDRFVAPDPDRGGEVEVPADGVSLIPVEDDGAVDETVVE